jgi:hypothetical protein
MMAPMAGLSAILIALVVMCLIGLILFSFVFWILMLISAIQNKGMTDGEKTGWVLAIVFFHIIGSLLYLCIGFPRRNGPSPISASAVRA